MKAMHRQLCVPKTSAALISRKNRLTSAEHDRAAVFRTGRLGARLDDRSEVNVAEAECVPVHEGSMCTDAMRVGHRSAGWKARSRMEGNHRNMRGPTGAAGLVSGGGRGGEGNPKPPRGALANQLRPRMTNTDTAHTAAEEIESIEINALGR